MKNEELMAENILLKEQVQQLTMQIEKLMKSTPSSELDWKSLHGTVNEKAAEFINNAVMKNNVLESRRNNKSAEPAWSKVDDVIYEANQIVIANQVRVHAVYEARERKHNAQLGLAPTLAELAQIVNEKPRPAQQKINPNDTNPDAASLSHTQAENQPKTLNR